MTGGWHDYKIFVKLFRLLQKPAIPLKSHKQAIGFLKKGQKRPFFMFRVSNLGQDGGGTVQVEKVGRNSPCPCGSGKKFKKCCGR